MIRILICEDEKLVANRLSRFAQESFDGQSRITMVDSLKVAIHHLSVHEIDLLFLDLNLHGKDSFLILKEFLHRSFHTIIVSAYTNRAIEAYEYGVLDFVGKPFTQERIQKAVDRYLYGTADHAHHTKVLTVMTRGNIEIIPLDQVKYIKAASIYSELHLFDGKVHLYDKPLNNLSKILPHNYIRVHRSYALNIDLIASITKIKHNSYGVMLRSGDIVPISRPMRKELLNTFHKS